MEGKVWKRSLDSPGPEGSQGVETTEEGAGDSPLIALLEQKPA